MTHENIIFPAQADFHKAYQREQLEVVVRGEAERACKVD